MVDLQQIGARVAMARKAAGYRRQEDFADALGVSRSAVAGIEAGSDRGGIVLAMKIADLLKVPLDWLLCRNVPRGGPLVGKFVDDPDELALIRFWESLTPAERAAALKMLRIPPA